MRKVLYTAAVLVFSMGFVHAQSGRDIAEKMDSVDRPADMASNSTLVLTNARGKTQEKTIRSLSAEDNSRQIIWFLAPARDKGVAFLKIEHSDAEDDMLLWLPAFKKVRRIKSSQKGESFMGSDMSYEDMTSRELSEYSYELLGEETLDGRLCWLLLSIPDEAVESSYSRIVSWVEKSSALPLKEEFYDRAGTLFKRKTIVYKRVESYVLPSEIFMEDLQNGSSTRLSITEQEVDKGYGEDVFQEKNLSRRPM